jgi:HEPN domain-containing protein
MNANATRLLKAAADDYAAARCLLLNGLVAGGLSMGAQAIEKFLKAYILLKSSARRVRGLSH